MSVKHTAKNASFAVTRTTNYNSIKISVDYEYGGQNPNGFTDKELTALATKTVDVAEKALEYLKTKVAVPATMQKINK